MPTTNALQRADKSSHWRSTPSMRQITSAAVLCFAASSAAVAADLAYLQTLLLATPEGGWVKASSNKFSNAWAPAGDQVSGNVPPYSYANPGSIVRAWSSFAWDSSRGDILLWGGGHGNYRGNEMYVWHGSNGAWDRGSLSSTIEIYAGLYLVKDDAAPQSAHTFDGNIYLPKNDMFVTFGGAAFNSGGAFRVRDGLGGVKAAGPWMWDPNKADPLKVGGTTGSGYNISRPGGEMWTNRAAYTSSVTPSNFIYASTAYREEAGKDVVYMYADPGGGNRGSLYRYEAGDVRSGGADLWQRVGVVDTALTSDNASAIDSDHGLFVHTSAVGTATKGLGVWDLSKSNAVNPSANRDIYISLTYADGSEFAVTAKHGLAYDDANDAFLLWDGSQAGTVWVTRPKFNPDGSLTRTWEVEKKVSVTQSQPAGQFSNGVYGKWEYVDELGAFIALNEYSPTTTDAEVWLYKPFATVVPEPSEWALLALGLGFLAVRNRRIQV